MDPFTRLIIATLLICGAWFGVRHHSRRRRGDARRQVEMIARLGLAKGVSVTVVRIAGRGLVLGVSDKGVSLVAELSGQALDDVVAATGRAGLPPAADPGLEPEPELEPSHQTAELHRRAELGGASFAGKFSCGRIPQGARGGDSLDRRTFASSAEACAGESF